MDKSLTALTNEAVAGSTSAFLVDKVHAGEILVITFGFVSWDNKPGFDFFGFLKNLETRYPFPINKILVRDNQNAWYHRGVEGLGADVDEVAAGLKEIIKLIRPSRVITIGQSMGAYAAIMFGALLQVDHVIAFGPLSFLNVKKALLYHERRWLPVMEDLEAKPPRVQYFDLPTLGRKAALAGGRTQYDIFFGTKPDVGGTESVCLDAVHANRLAVIPGCRIHPYPESEHVVSKYLHDRNMLHDLLYRQIAVPALQKRSGEKQ